MICEIINIVHSRGMFFLCLNLYIVLYVSDQCNWIKITGKQKKKIPHGQSTFLVDLRYPQLNTIHNFSVLTRKIIIESNTFYAEASFTQIIQYRNSILFSVLACPQKRLMVSDHNAVNFHKANTICCPLETAPIYYCYFLYSTGILSVKLFSFDGTILVLNVTNRDKIERLLPPLSNGRCIGFFLPQVDVMFCALKGRISDSWRNYQHLYIFLLLQVLIHCKVEFHKENWRHLSMFCPNLIILKGHPVTQAKLSCIGKLYGMVKQNQDWSNFRINEMWIAVFVLKIQYRFLFYFPVLSEFLSLFLEFRVVNILGRMLLPPDTPLGNKIIPVILGDATPRKRFWHLWWRGKLIVSLRWCLCRFKEWVIKITKYAGNPTIYGCVYHLSQVRNTFQYPLSKRVKTKERRF